MSEFFKFCKENFDSKYSKKFEELAMEYLDRHNHYRKLNYAEVFWKFEENLYEFVKYDINSSIDIHGKTYVMPALSNLADLDTLIVNDGIAKYVYKSGEKGEYFTRIPDMNLILISNDMKFEIGLYRGDIGVRYDCANERLEFFLNRYFLNNSVQCFTHTTTISIKISDINISKNRGLLTKQNGIECINKDLLGIIEVLDAI